MTASTHISFEISKEVMDAIGKLGADASQAAKESFLVDLYRQGTISLRVLGAALGLARLEVDAILERHDVSSDLTLEEFRSEAASLQKLRQ
jgi:hypothetical protein